MDEEVISISWTITARNSFDKIVEYLTINWSEKVVSSFINRVTRQLSVIQRYPEICRPSAKKKNTRICALDMHNKWFTIIQKLKIKSLYYHSEA